MINHIKTGLTVMLIVVGIALFITAVVLSWPELMQISDLQRQALSKVWPYIVGGIASILIGCAIVFWWL